MKKFEAIKAQYINQGVKEDNILYAIDAVKEGRWYIVQAHTGMGGCHLRHIGGYRLRC